MNKILSIINFAAWCISVGFWCVVMVGWLIYGTAKYGNIIVALLPLIMMLAPFGWLVLELQAWQQRRREKRGQCLPDAQR